MNPALALLGVAELALSLAEARLDAETQQDAAIADVLIEIVRKGAEAYQQHTGEALNPPLIRPEPPMTIPPPAPTP